MRYAYLAAVAALGSCSSGGGIGTPEAYSYKVTEDGGPSTTDEKTFESLGDKTFTKTQKYKIVALSDSGRRFHFLVANVEKKIGKKIEEKTEGLMIPINDGVYTFECTHWYDVKIGTPDSSIDDPTCDVEPVGVITTSAPATIATAEPPTKS